MEIIVDASVIIAVIAGEPGRGSLVRASRGATLNAPSSLHWEIGNAFSSMLKRGRISLGESLKAISIYNEIPIRFLDVTLEESLKIASKAGLYAYDAYYISCAMKHKMPIISLDKKLIASARQFGIESVEVK